MLSISETAGGIDMSFYAYFCFYFISICIYTIVPFFEHFEVLFVLAYLPLVVLDLYKFRSKNLFIVLFSSFLYLLLNQYDTSYYLLYGYSIFTTMFHEINHFLHITEDDYFFDQKRAVFEEDKVPLLKTIITPFLITLIFIFCIVFDFHLHAVEYAIMLFFILFFDFNKIFRIFERCVVYHISVNNIFIFQFSKFLDLSRASNFIFSKTGVLTLGNLSVTEIHVEEKKKEKQLIEVLAYAEYYSNNRIGNCIHQYCNDIVKVDEKKIREYQDFQNGVSVLVSKKRYLVGNYEFMMENGIEVEKSLEVGTILYVAIDKEYIGFVTISDQISMKVKKELENIKKLRPVHFTTFSKDNGRITRAVSNTVGIYDCYSEVTLKDRDYWIQYLKEIHPGFQVYITDEVTSYPFDIKVGYGDLRTNDFDIIVRDHDFSILTLLYQYSLKVSSYKRTWRLLGIFMKFILIFLLLWIRDILVIGSLIVSTAVISLGILIFITFYHRKGVGYEEN